MAKINLDEIDFKSRSYDEILKWFLLNIKEIDGYDRAHTSYTVSYDKMAKILDCQKELEYAPYYVDEYTDALVNPFEEDKDFFRKNNFEGYHPRHAPVIGDIYFSDYTDDIINAYLEYKYGINNSKKSINNQINIIEIVEDKTEYKKVSFYINKDYSRPFEFNRNKTWTPLYDLARDQEVEYNRSFFNYINSNKKNPLYSKHKFINKQILKMDGESIKPNIPISFLSQKTVTTRKNKKFKA